MMKKLIAALITLFVFSCPVTSAHAGGVVDRKNTQNRLILTQGTTLLAYFNGQYKEVEIKNVETFYGYGWLDDHRVFVAYQPKGEAEAVAVIEVIDTLNNHSKKLLNIGGAGETNFDVNPDTKLIVFNDNDGIKLMTINLNDLSFHIKLVKKDDSAWGTFWINSQTIGYLNDNGQLIKIKSNGQQ